MLDAHELLCLTHTTMYSEGAWDTVRDAIFNQTDPVELALVIEDLLIVAAGMAIHLGGYEERDALTVIDNHFHSLHEGTRRGD
jgi:hypothetical protein